MPIPLAHASVVISARLWRSGSGEVGEARLANGLGEGGVFEMELTKLRQGTRPPRRAERKP